jgi:hypothetical protein
MKYIYYLGVFFIFFIPPLWSQNVETKVVFNNTKDMKQLKSIIEELKSAVNKNDLQNALNVNENITDKNLKFEIVFFDRNYVGNLKLKTPHVLSIDGYKEKWKANTKNSSAVLFLFVKEDGKAEYEFKGLSVSKQLEDKHLFEKVVEFINEHLNGSHKTIVTNGSKYLARAITPVWTEAKQNEAQSLIEQNRYKADHINYFHGNWRSTFLDIKPISLSVYLMPNLVKVWFLANNDTLKTTSIYADTTVFKGNNVTIEGEGYSFSFLGVTIPLSEASQERVLIFQPKNQGNESQSYIKPLVEALQESNKYSSSKKVSEWDWNKSSNGTFSLNSTNGLTDINTNNKFELIKVDMNATYPEGAEIPVIHPWCSGRTYCNVYASDLARNVLFPNMFTSGANYAPWGAHQSASKLHDILKGNTNGQFKAVTHDEAWKYTNAGYVVYLTAYNWRYYNNTTNDPHRYSGHIATCYQTIGYREYEKARLIQAGSSTGELAFKEVWGENMRDNHVKANLYLGYIIK